MCAPFVASEERTTLRTVKTVALLLVAATVGVQPDAAAVGETITVTGPPGRAVTLEPFDTTGGPTPLGATGADGTLVVELPDVAAGRYRIVVRGEPEAPLLEVTALSRDTSLLLLGFGVLLVLALLVGGVVLHRRWQDAIR
jgi:hypothetical protein